MPANIRSTPKDDAFTVRTLRLRLKDKHAPWCTERAVAVNQVWNFSNAHSAAVFERERRFVSAFDLHPYTCGAAKEGLALHSQTIQAVAEEYVKSRKQHKKVKLRWRVSNPKSARRSLGWVPFKASAISYKGGQVMLFGQKLSLWDSWGLSRYELGAGSISEDARGHWYLNITVKALEWPRSQDLAQVKSGALGIDLGLKDLMADSDGGTMAAQQFYRDLEPKLAVAQRAGHKQRTRAIHAKIANRRRDHLHKLSTSQVGSHPAIFVGDVNARSLATNTMAKSVLDAGWSIYRTMLKYKCDNAGVWFREIDESFSTQECGSCHERTGPKGLAGLAVRRWTCSACGVVHERDTNSSDVIKQRGLQELELEFAAALDRAHREPASVVNKDSGA